MPDNDSIIQYLKKMEKNVKAIQEEIADICWGMRGSLSYNEAYMTSRAERHIMLKLMNKKLEATQKTGLMML